MQVQDGVAVEIPAPAAAEPAAEPAAAEVVPGAEAAPPPAEPAPGAEPKPDTTPPAVKAEITKERNRRREAERLAADAVADRKRLMDLVDSVIPKKPAEPDDPQPAQDQFQDPDAYQTALFRWGVRQEAKTLIADERKKEAAAKAQAEAAETARSYSERLEQAKAKYEDFDDVTEVPTLPISQAMAEVITRSDVGPDLYYYLGKNPAEAARIAALQPLLAARELGKLEGKLAGGAAAAPAAPVSRAPAPIRPLSPGAASTVEAEDSMEALEKKWGRSQFG